MTPTRGPDSSSSLRSNASTGGRNSSPDSSPIGPEPFGKRSAARANNSSAFIRARVRCPSMERRRVSSGSPYEPVIGFSRALRVGDRVLVSGTAPIWPDGAVDPDPATQMRRCFEIIAAALDEAGATLADVVRTRTYLVDPVDAGVIQRVHGDV